MVYFFHQNITFVAFYFQHEMYMYKLITMNHSIIDRIPNLDLEKEQFYDIGSEVNSCYIGPIHRIFYALMHVMPLF